MSSPGSPWVSFSVGLGFCSNAKGHMQACATGRWGRAWFCHTISSKRLMCMHA